MDMVDENEENELLHEAAIAAAVVTVAMITARERNKRRMMSAKETTFPKAFRVYIAYSPLMVELGESDADRHISFNSKLHNLY